MFSWTKFVGMLIILGLRRQSSLLLQRYNVFYQFALYVADYSIALFAAFQRSYH